MEGKEEGIRVGVEVLGGGGGVGEGMEMEVRMGVEGMEMLGRGVEVEGRVWRC